MCSAEMTNKQVQCKLWQTRKRKVCVWTLTIQTKCCLEMNIWTLVLVDIIQKRKCSTLNLLKLILKLKDNKSSMALNKWTQCIRKCTRRRKTTGKQDKEGYKRTSVETFSIKINNTLWIHKTNRIRKIINLKQLSNATKKNCMLPTYSVTKNKYQDRKWSWNRKTRKMKHKDTKTINTLIYLGMNM